MLTLDGECFVIASAPDPVQRSCQLVDQRALRLRLRKTEKNALDAVEELLVSKLRRATEVMNAHRTQRNFAMYHPLCYLSDQFGISLGESAQTIIMLGPSVVIPMAGCKSLHDNFDGSLRAAVTEILPEGTYGGDNVASDGAEPDGDPVVNG